MKQYVRQEMIAYVKSLKKNTNISRDKHLCDHILWLIDDYYKLESAFLKTLLGRVLIKK